MIKHFIWIFPFLAMSFLASCQVEGLNGSSTPVPQLSVTETRPSATQTPSPTTFTTATASPIPILSNTISPTETATPVSTNSSIFPPEAQIQFHCLEILPALTEWGASRGVVVLDNQILVDDRVQIEDYLLDMETGEIIQYTKENEGGSDYSISPDKKLAAYTSNIFDPTGRFIKEELVVSTANKQRLAVIPWEAGWVGIPGWLDNEWLVINISGLDPEESALRKPAQLLALNPFSGERKILAPDFPNIHTADYFDWAGWSRTMYDPTLTRVVYLTEYNNFSFTLWDLEQSQSLVSLGAFFPMQSYIPIPRWAPDGSRFAVVAYEPIEQGVEVFQVSRDGQQIEQLTNLYAYNNAVLAGFSWSPDSRYLAGWLDISLGQSPELELVVLDTLTEQITDYCLQIKYRGSGEGDREAGEFYGGYPLEPLWSPDGSQLIVKEHYHQEHWRVYLVDLVQGFAVQIAEDMEPVGWMLAP